MDYDPIGDMVTQTAQSIDNYALQQAIQEDEQLKRERQRQAQEAAALQAEQEAATKKKEAAAPKKGEVNIPVLTPVANASKEITTAVTGGMIDFVDDTGELVGKLAGQDWEFIPDDWGPQNKTEWGNALRSVVSFIGPTIGVGSIFRAGLRGLATKAGLGSLPKAVNFVGKMGADMAAGSAVDVINRHSEGDNLIRTLKDHVPGAVGWLPDDWATLDTDSPDIKRKKNILEGAGLGTLGSIIEAGIAWSRALKGTSLGTQFIPKDSTAVKGFQDITLASPLPKSGHPFVDRILKDTEYYDKHIDEMADVELKLAGGDVNALQSFNPNIHSLASDYYESLPRAVRPDGLPQALVDNVRILNNIDSVDGRMSKFLTDPAVRSLGFDDIEGRTLIKEIEKRIGKLGNFEAKLPNGRMMNHKEIMGAADNLAADILDSGLSGSDLHKLFDFKYRDVKEVAPGVQIHPLTDTARVAAERALSELKKEYLSVSKMRASALFQTSVAGDVSDFANASRVMGDAIDDTYIKQRIIQKMEPLWYEVELNKSVAGWALNNQKVFGQLTRQGDSKAIQKFAQDAKRSIKSQVAAKVDANRDFLVAMEEMTLTNPKFVDPLMRAYELSDGNVNTIHKLNKYMGNVLGVVNKAFIDGEPQIPSQVIQGLFGTFYNLKLSSLLTPVKAISNNMALLLMKPANVILGAAIRGDGQTIHRAWVQYATHMDTTMKGSAEYMGQMFKKVAADPSLTQRADFVTQNKQMVQLAREYATAEASRGNYYPQMKVNFVDMMEKINNHPWVRYSMNFMESGDAFVKATVGMADARGRAFDDLIKEGKKITPEAIDEASRKIYREMFDDDGLITDKAVTYASREISMNLQNDIADGVNAMLSKAPILKTLVMFPRTSINVLDFVHKHSPLSAFIGELNTVKNLKEVDEITQFLATKGINYSEQNWKAFRAEVEGRVAMGTGLITMGGWMYAQGNLTGNGNYDKQVTKFQQNAAEKPLRSWKSPLDGKWRTYDGIEPIGTFLALTADILENIDTLGSTKSEQLLQKLGYAMSMNLTNKSFMQGLQPITEMMSGQPAAISRWASNVASVGLFTQMARVMNSGLREVDTDLQTMLRNKWNILDQVGAGQPLPFKYDFIDGSIVGREDPITNLFNNLLPFKVSSNPSPIKQFLIDTEFDVQPSLKASIKGAPYDVHQRSRLAQIMGESGHFRRGLEVLMQDKKVQEDLAAIKQAREKGITSDVADLSNSYTHIKIRRLLNQSVNHAKRELAREIPEIRMAELQALRNKQAQKRRDYSAINLLNK